MASKSHLSFAERSQVHPNPLVRKLFALAERKRSNIVLSADVKSTAELLAILDATGPYIVVVKTHIDTLTDFSSATVTALQQLSTKHDFLIFEDRKFTDIGNTVKDQYAGGIFRIHDWAHIVNCLVNPGPGIVQALEQVIQHGDPEDRGVLILAEMTSKGSTCTGAYTQASVEIARKFPTTVMGWVATRELSQHAASTVEDEDFVVFTTGVNISSTGDALGQQYQTPTTAMAGGSDFLIVGRGIYAAVDPVGATRQYQREGWIAYRNRVESSEASRTS